MNPGTQLWELLQDQHKTQKDLLAVLTRIAAKLGDDAAPRDHTPTADAANADGAFIRQLANALRTRWPGQPSLFLAGLTGQQLDDRLTRIAERLDDEADRREEIFRLPDPPVPS